LDENQMSLDFFKDDGVFLPMLNDVGRNAFYKDALKIAAPGKTVCDIGAGTGFLSVLAAQSGAARVIAVEQNAARCEYLEKNIKKVGLDDLVQVVHGDFLDLDISADVYVSETINTQIFGENIIALSNHAQRHGGEFIPSQFKIWAEVYRDHPIFILDLLHNESYDFSPGVEIDSKFSSLINQDFLSQYNLQDTVFKANQLNRLFPMLDRFNDVKLISRGTTQPIVVDLNTKIDENNIMLTVPGDLIQSDFDLVVIKWQAIYKTVTLNHDQCWFGNVAKQIHRQFKTQHDVVFKYDPVIRDWRLKY
jgi:SAM-dependent methyltransferase